jgi:hypothetical protein
MDLISEVRRVEGQTAVSPLCVHFMHFVFGRAQCNISAPRASVLSLIFYGFSQPLNANAGIVPQMGDEPMTPSFLFIIY